jgi:hypothetical protein
VEEFLLILERDLESDISSLESVLGQAMYFGLRLVVRLVTGQYENPGLFCMVQSFKFEAVSFKL